MPVEGSRDLEFAAESCLNKVSIVSASLLLLQSNGDSVYPWDCEMDEIKVLSNNSRFSHL